MVTVVNNSSAETGELREIIAQALCAAGGDGFLCDCSERRQKAYRIHADAVLAVLPDPPQGAPNKDALHRLLREYVGFESYEIDKLADAILALTRPEQGSEPQTPTVTPEMVEAVRKAKCFACGAFPYEDCQRHPQRDCGREFNGGSRKAKRA